MNTASSASAGPNRIAFREGAMPYRITSATELRAAPSKTAPVVASLAVGTLVERAGKKQRHWLPVRHGGESGWVAERTVARVAPDAPDQSWSEAEIIEIIREAARAFGQPEEDLIRVGRCESSLDPRAQNPAGPYFGLFQFLRSTWASTPYADRDIFDPVANANAAGWMWQQGRRNEWACQ
jgi:hypothetical protein